jgi:hypothetical protein
MKDAAIDIMKDAAIDIMWGHARNTGQDANDDTVLRRKRFEFIIQ